MNNSLDINVLAALAKRALDEQTNGKEFMLADIHNQARQAYAAFPEDAVIRQFAFTVEKMLDKAKPGATISQAQMSGIYNNFAHVLQDSSFKKTLGHLLLDKHTNTSNSNQDFVRLNRVDADNGQLTNDKLADQNMVNALNAAFGGPMNGVKAFDQEMARRGVDYVKAELQAIGHAKADVEVMGGDNSTLVYASHFDTNKGRVTVAIPISLSNGKLVLPSTFVADDKLAELSASNLSYFISKKSENKDFSAPRVNDVLHAVGILTGSIRSATNSDFDKAGDVFGDAGNTMALSTPSLFADRKYEDGKPDLDFKVNAEMPKELAHLARDFEDQMLEAVSVFGKDAVTAGKSLVLLELASAQLKGAQVKYGSETKDSIVYLATINTPVGKVDIEVPVEMRKANNVVVPLSPASFVFAGNVMEFTGPSLQRFASNLKEPSSSLVSDQYKLMLLPELRNEILKAAGSHKYSDCETILAHIHDRFSEDDYRNSVNDYQFALLTKNRMNVAEQTKCSKMIQAGHGSIYARCGHYGVPMHQVMNDAEGKCIMKSTVEREKLNPVEESGASISTAKIFMA